MADINKAIKPIESARIAPLNDGTIYQANKEIVFRLGAGLNMFLVNKSYLTFNLKCAGKTFTNVLNRDGTADAPINNFYPSYIRNACCIDFLVVTRQNIFATNITYINLSLV